MEVDMSAKALERLGSLRHYLEALEQGRTRIDPSDAAGVKRLEEHLWNTLEGLSRLAPLDCNGNRCLPGFECVQGICKPIP
jgi:hypothetical protein